MPWLVQLLVQSPTSLAPRWIHAPGEPVNTHAAPRSPLSFGAPISAVLALPDSARLKPNSPAPFSPMPWLVQLAVQSPTSLGPCWVVAPGEPTNNHAAPTLPLSNGAPISAVLPSADSATLTPNPPAPFSPVPWLVQLPVQSPTILAPCWIHAPGEPVNTHAAPTPLWSLKPPTSAVSPSADSARL